MAEGQPLNNADYLAQDYSTSIEHFDKRLMIAKECNDQIGQRRAHTNLGNAYFYFEDFDKCLHHYREAMNLGELMNDGLFLAQMSFMIGYVYNFKQDYETSIYFHEKHLNLAQQFQDPKGQCRAYLMLNQLNEKIQRYDKAKKCFTLYKALEREFDNSNEEKSKSKSDLPKNLRAESISVTLSESHIPYSGRSNSVVNNCLTSPVEDKSLSNTNKKLKINFIQHLTKKSPITARKESSPAAPDELADIVYRMQKSRFDDQRCDIKMTNNQRTDRKTSHDHPSDTHLDDILNTVDRLSQFRLDDQRTTFPSPTIPNNTRAQRLSSVNEHLFDQIAKCQGSRLEDQRAVLLPLPNHNKSTTSRAMSASPIITTASQTKNSLADSTSKTLPDEEFFSLLNCLQTRRTDQQRTRLSSAIHSPSKQTRIKS